MGPYSRFPRRGGLGDSGSSASTVNAGIMGNVPAGAGGSIVQGDGFYYIYNILLSASVAAGVTANVSQQFDQVSVFKWVRTTAYADLAGAPQTSGAVIVPLVSLKITDAGSGMSFMNSAVPLPSMAGTAQLPYVLPTPQFILANAQLQFITLNLSAGTTYTNLYLQLHGYKLYNYQAGQGAQ